jgi:2-hydroxychromene-2-carboxylate isomerase
MSVPRLYFSFRSPFSWLLVEQLRRAVPDALETFELVPYWEPDDATAAALAARGAAIHYAPMSKAKHLYILQDVKRLATGLDLELRWPVDVAPWWEPSHLGWLAARRAGAQTAFYDAVVRARWAEGRDISRVEVVARAATAAGLDGDALAGAVGDAGIRAEGVECLYRAYDEDIFGVPYLRLGWQRFWGLDRLPHFLAAAGLPGGERPAPADGAHAQRKLGAIPQLVLDRPGMYDDDTAGGCG